MTVLPGRRYPDLINDDEKLLENSFVVPDAALADVSAALRGRRAGGASGQEGRRGHPPRPGGRPMGEPGRRTATGFHPGAATVA